MSSVRELLDNQSSELAAVLRYSLVGLRASLDTALRDHLDDPGSVACRRVVDELGELLEGNAPAELGAVPASDGASVTNEPAGTSAELALRELLALPSAPQWLRELDTTLPPAELWQRFHVAALRLPETAARNWRASVTRVLSSSSPSCDSPWRTLPGGTETVLVPPFAGAYGLRTAADAPADGDIADCLGFAGVQPAPNGEELARLATTVAAMTELDVDLWLGLESVRYKGLGRLDKALRTAYRRDLLDRLASYGRTRYGSAESFEALLLVDEALHSVLHLPPAAPGSWWAELQEESRALVFQAQRDHPGVSVQLLARPYRETKDMTGGNDIRIQHDGSGAVLGCIRLWAEVNGRPLPGRVVYAG